MPTPWERFKQAARLAELDQVPVGLIVDSPWLPGYAGIDTRDYFLSPNRWLEINLGLLDRFPSPDGEDDRAALEIALAATESLKSERPIKLFGRQRA